jgi:hypothetical protein
MIFICSESSKELKNGSNLNKLGIAFGRFQYKMDNGWYVIQEARKSSKNNECKGS